jgi:predicted CXXCH cytochrome family protein
VLHGPYKAGQCLICHNPHAGDYKAQTRAAVNTLCLSCHMLNQPEARVNPQSKIVTLLDGRVYDLASWQSAPKIGDGHPKSTPRVPNDAVSVNAPGKHEAETDCLSCHDPHASKAEHLLRNAAEARGAAGNFPVRSRHNLVDVKGISQGAPMSQGPISGGAI